MQLRRKTRLETTFFYVPVTSSGNDNIPLLTDRQAKIGFLRRRDQSDAGLEINLKEGVTTPFGPDYGCRWMLDNIEHAAERIITMSFTATTSQSDRRCSQRYDRCGRERHSRWCLLEPRSERFREMKTDGDDIIYGRNGNDQLTVCTARTCW